MKVLTVLNSLTIGGIENTLYACLPHLREDGVEICVCCFKKDGNLESEFRKLGVEVFYIKKTGSFILDTIQLLLVLRKKNIDIVHSRLSYTSGGFAIACWLKRIPLIVSIHNEFAATLVSWQKYFILKLIRKGYLALHKKLVLNYASKIVGHSKANLSTNYPNWENQSKYEIVYNGVDFTQLDRSKESNLNKQENNKIRILHIGTFKAQKNHLFLLECFKRIKKEIELCELILVGDGPLRPEIEKKIEQDGLSGSVILAGYSQDVGVYLSQADLFLFPSIFEGLANVLLEAQYFEIPIIASDIKPHYESVYRGYHQFFFNPYDVEGCLSNLRKIISEILSDNISKEVIEAKKFIVENFSIEKMAQGLSGVYRKVLTEGIKTV